MADGTITMARPHQPDRVTFRSILPEQIDWRASARGGSCPLSSGVPPETRLRGDGQAARRHEARAAQASGAPRLTRNLASDVLRRGRILERIEQAIPDAKITSSGSEGAISQLIVRQGGVQTKIEVTPVLRGTVYEPGTGAVSDALEAAFGFTEY